jgi:N-acetylglucosaminyl-diphospho-decaprenol L-rhamnosyltransferase
MESLAPTVALILHFRQVDATVRCLLALIADDVKDAVIVDNSADEGKSLNVLRSNLERKDFSGLNIRFLLPEMNLGFARGVNRGLETTRSVYPGSPVLLINSDAELVKGAHKRLRDLVQPGSAPAIAAPAIDGPNGLVSAVVHYHHLTGTLHRRSSIFGSHKLLGGCCLMVHPALCAEKLFDEDFFFYGDDIELGYRMGQMGVELVDASPALVRHEGSGSSRNGSLFYEYHMARAHLVLSLKVARAMPRRFLLLAVRLLILPIRAAVRSIRFRSFTAWKGLNLALQDFYRHKISEMTPPPSDGNSR